MLGQLEQDFTIKCIAVASNTIKYQNTTKPSQVSDLIQSTQCYNNAYR